MCTSCRAQNMLSNAYFLANFRFDTAENEPTKNLQNFANFCGQAAGAAREAVTAAQKELRQWWGAETETLLALIKEEARIASACVAAKSDASTILRRPVRF